MELYSKLCIFAISLNQQTMSEENQPVEKKYSPEELKKMRDNTMQYYKEQIQVLKLQDEFEKLHASIVESQAKTMMYNIKMATMAMGPKLDEKDKEEEEVKVRETPLPQEKTPELTITP